MELLWAEPLPAKEDHLRVTRRDVGSAHADETDTASHNGPRVGLVNVGQVDDPMEDVLEHLLLIGDGYCWN
ncbi:hypothetical protein [Streptomyces canus]|uniref:hypothetical protein n=1 Tax=Streptomyces canus TaxID=58343 RepID=UPI00358EF2B2